MRAWLRRLFERLSHSPERCVKCIEIRRLLSERPMYGLDMIRQSDILKRGTIYVHLSRMEECGLVERDKSSMIEGIARYRYRLTDG